MISPYLDDEYVREIQAYAYLLLDKKRSKGILFDLGPYTKRHKTIENVRKIIDPKGINYVVLSHPDIDVIGFINELIEINKDITIVTTEINLPLLKTFIQRLPKINIIKEECEYNLNDIRLLFVPTPNVHTPGSFIVYCYDNKCIFSFDLFSGFYRGGSLFAEDREYLVEVEKFINAYFQDRFEVSRILDRLLKLDIEWICPHHGKIIGKDLIEDVFRLYYSTYYKISTDNPNLEFVKITSSIIRDLSKSTGINYYPSYDEKRLSFVSIIKKNISELTGNSLDIVIYAKTTNNVIIIEESHIKVEEINNYKDIITFNTLLKFRILEEKITIFGKELEPRVLSIPIIKQTGEIIVVVLHNLQKDIETDKIAIVESIIKDLEYILTSKVKELACIKEREDLVEMATRCKLTRLYNRNFFETDAKKEFLKANRYNYPLSLIMLDIDDFKKINDIYGHIIGDIVLKELSKTIVENIRKVDIPVRYGGDEIIILLPYTPKSRAVKIAERIKKNLAKHPIETPDGPIKINISVGITEYKRGESVEETLKRVDNALYTSKRQGKNKISVI
jgi:diguanylate cyclase (GGDEF)-like protein